MFERHSNRERNRSSIYSADSYGSQTDLRQDEARRLTLQANLSHGKQKPTCFGLHPLPSQKQHQEAGQEVEHAGLQDGLPGSRAKAY